MVVEESNPLSARSGRLDEHCRVAAVAKTLSPKGAVLVGRRPDVEILNHRNELSSGCKMTSSSSVAAVMSTSSNLGTAVGCRSEVDVLEHQNHPRTAVSPREALAESAVEPDVLRMPGALKAAVLEKGGYWAGLSLE